MFKFLLKHPQLEITKKILVQMDQHRKSFADDKHNCVYLPDSLTVIFARKSDGRCVAQCDARQGLWVCNVERRGGGSYVNIWDASKFILKTLEEPELENPY